MICYDSLTVALLRAELIKKNFIQGENKCNYELYLLELLNKSSWIQSLYPGEFVAPKSEAHGECDAYNMNYQIDFKLFAANSALRARNLLSRSITKTESGLTIYGNSKSHTQELLVTRLFAAFRGKNVDDLKSICNKPAKKYSVEYDIKKALKNLKISKNILLLFPYTFSFKNVENDQIENNYQYGIEIIRGALSSDFKYAFCFRDIYANGYETYLTCLFNNRFLLFQVVDDDLVLRDIVDSDLLPTYRLLSDYNEF